MIYFSDVYYDKLKNIRKDVCSDNTEIKINLASKLNDIKIEKYDIYNKIYLNSLNDTEDLAKKIKLKKLKKLKKFESNFN